MRKFICLFVICFLSIATTLRAWEGNVLVSTPNTSIILSATEGQQLRFSYFGERVEEDQIHQVFDAWTGFHRPAYPVFGTSTYEISALHAVHADCDPTASEPTGMPVSALPSAAARSSVRCK